MSSLPKNISLVLLGCVLSGLPAKLDASWTVDTSIAAAHLGGASTRTFGTEKEALAFLAEEEKYGGYGMRLVPGGHDDTSGGGTMPGIGSSPQQAAEQIAGQIGTQIGNAIANEIFGPHVPSAAQLQQQQAQWEAEQRRTAALQLNNSGIYLLKHKNYTGAINEFEQALARTPDDQAIANNLAHAKQLLAKSISDHAQAAKNSNTLAGLLGGSPAAATPQGPTLARTPFNLVNLDSSVVDLGGTTKTALDPALIKNEPGPATAGEPTAQKDLEAQFDRAVNAPATPVAGDPPGGSNDLNAQFDQIIPAPANAPGQQEAASAVFGSKAVVADLAPDSAPGATKPTSDLGQVPVPESSPLSLASQEVRAQQTVAYVEKLSTWSPPPPPPDAGPGLASKARSQAADWLDQKAKSERKTWADQLIWSRVPGYSVFNYAEGQYGQAKELFVSINGLNSKTITQVFGSANQVASTLGTGWQGDNGLTDSLETKTNDLGAEWKDSMNQLAFKRFKSTLTQKKAQDDKLGDIGQFNMQDPPATVVPVDPDKVSDYGDWSIAHRLLTKGEAPPPKDFAQTMKFLFPPDSAK